MHTCPYPNPAPKVSTRNARRSNFSSARMRITSSGVATGSYDHDTLAYLIVALRPAVRKKIPEVVPLAQLEREYRPGLEHHVEDPIRSAAPED
ncbi:uncharacterized protein ARMOST_15552 [Armillaria ostoyae]|uniref:Uncharacterized protein n=1 Tax=Armillaria ostoyae TaxID=47428 RepID=A0A284RTL3_ARMOS|nr:uncharacterized protein ARMOST_15552 [Armillaria ostoyae]